MSRRRPRRRARRLRGFFRYRLRGVGTDHRRDRGRARLSVGVCRRCQVAQQRRVARVARDALGCRAGQCRLTCGSGKEILAAWKKTGAAKLTESIRSIIPPWPSIIVPQSLAPRLRFTADSTRPPRKPISTVTKAMTADCSGVNGDPPHRSADQRGARRSADETLDGLGRADHGSDLGFAEELAAHILQHVADLHDQHQIEHQWRFAGVAGYRQNHQRRHVADAVDRDHQAPLDPGAALEKVLVSCARIEIDGEQEAIDRDEDGGQAVPVSRNQQIIGMMRKNATDSAR